MFVLLNVYLNKEYDKKWQELIRLERFKWHNSRWLQLALKKETSSDAKLRHIEGGDNVDTDEEDESLPNQDYLMASSLLEDVADWFGTASPTPQHSAIPCLGSKSDLNINLQDIVTCYSGEVKLVLH